MSENAKPSLASRLFKRYALDALGAMALGLFSTLIIGTILNQLGTYIPGLSILCEFAAVAQSGTVVGAAIGVSVAWGMKVAPLAMFTSAVSGAIGYAAGAPLGAYIAAVFGAEAGNFIAGKTRVDIILVPTATILVGGLAATLTGPGVTALMNGLRDFIDMATRLQPVPMGILVSVVVGLALTAPISSAALCAMIFSLPESGELGIGLKLAAGAATVGCCCQMVGFAVSTFRENGVGGLVAQGIGTSMLQVPNILRHPAILIPPTLASAILGPIATTILPMHNSGVFAGMGTAGFVGQIGTWNAMAAAGGATVLLKILLLHIALPAALSLLFSEIMRRMGWIHEGDGKLPL
ncbi:MAG: PTS sugar transporter subunit IIC [Clostridia bacterium]|nr:PTS sugar transporter subunit IIC [Clostridia bacterium]